MHANRGHLREGVLQLEVQTRRDVHTCNRKNGDCQQSHPSLSKMKIGATALKLLLALLLELLAVLGHEQLVRQLDVAHLGELDLVRNLATGKQKPSQ